MSFNLMAAYAWPVDPLANVNLFNKGVASQKVAPAKTADEQNGECLPPTSCPICPVSEEWPLDFDRDDLAEKAELRRCAPNELGVEQELVIIFSSKGEPLIYKANFSCKTKKPFTFSHFERADFNRDNYDELLLVERDLETGSEQVKVLGYNTSQALITELPIVEFETDLQDYLRQGETNESNKLSFAKKNANYGFNLACQTALGRIFRINYYQDKADRAFYPLKISEVKSVPVMAMSAKPVQTKKTQAGVELIE
jgi:hypothetical protein